MLEKTPMTMMDFFGKSEGF